MNGKIRRVNMTDLTVSDEELAGEYAQLGGRGLTSFIVAREVPPTCHPLSAHNKLVFAPGALTGTSAPSSGRLSVGSKSPLTGGIKESNVGGTAGIRIARVGLRALVLEGCAKAGETYILYITKDGASLIPNGRFEGLGNYSFVRQMVDKYGDKVSVVSIGPAGEMRLSSATIAVTDMQMRPARHAGRGGVGAVMGSKGLKAIVIDDSGTSPVEPMDRDGFKAGQRTLVKALAEHPVTGGGLATFGTAALVNVINATGGFPTRNFRFGQFEDAENISGEAMNRTLTSRPGGKVGHACMPGCVIKCSNVYVNEQGEYVTSGLEYETLWANGANCGVGDLDTIARIDRLCDDYGLDTMETGAAIAVAMEAGLENFGDAEAAIGLIQEIGEGTPLGRILGHGAEFTGKAFGIVRVPSVKGQSMSAYDPRAYKSIGVTYAMSPMGADHTAGWTVGRNMAGDVPALSSERGQADLSKEAQTLTAALDCTGFCTFVNDPIGGIPGTLEAVVQMYGSQVGASLTVDSFLGLGRKLLAVERDFNIRAGLGRVHDRLPFWMTEEPLPPHNSVYDVPDEYLDSVFES